MKIARISAMNLSGLAILAFVSLMQVSVVDAHRSPVGCTGSGLGIALYSVSKKVSVGDSVPYSIDVFNGLTTGPVVCNASNIQASIVTPDGVVHPITLLRTALTNGQTDHYANVVTYVVRAQDIQSDQTLRATASDTGSIHQNNTDSVGGSSQGVNVGVLVTTPPPVINTGGGGFVPPPIISIIKTPNPSSLPNGPGTVLYTYTVSNGGRVALRGVWVRDNKCEPVEFITGDTNGDAILDLTETWTYRCSKVLTQTETNLVTTHGSGNGWDAYDTAEATVNVGSPASVLPIFLALLPPPPIVLSPVVTPTSPVFIPDFPSAGLPPQKQNSLINIAVLIGFMLVSITTILVHRKQI